MKNVPKDMLRRDDVVWWMQHLEMVDHYVEPETALTIANWWDDRRGPLILEGPPGGGKTSLAKKIAELMGVPFYRLQCYKSIGKGETLYDWDKNVQGVLVQKADANDSLGEEVNKVIYKKEAMVLGILTQALEDPDEDVIVLIDELDKIPNEEAFEGLLLEFLEEATINVPELNSFIKARAGKPPHIIITSNAGRGGLKESLSHPVLRRGRYVYLPEPDPGRQFSILEQAAPNLSKTVIRDIVAFTHWAKKLVRFEKPIALSEVIMWARTLEMCKVKELTASVIDATVAELAKREKDTVRLLAAKNRLLKIIHKAYYQDRNVLQFPTQSNVNLTKQETINTKQTIVAHPTQNLTKKLVKIR